MASIQETKGVVRQITVNKMDPKILNIRWMTVVLLALTFVPMEASTAVKHVPIFCPNSTYTALERGIIPVPASACKIPTEADED